MSQKGKNQKTNDEALPGVWGNRGTRAFISREQGNKGQFLRGTGEQRQYWGTGNIENKFSIFGEQGNKPIYFRGTREQVPPLRGPQWSCKRSPDIWAQYKHKTYKTWIKIAEQTLTLITNNTHLLISILHKQNSRSQDVIISEESIIVTFSHIKA